MASLGEMVQAGGSVRIAGKEYELSVLTLRDFGEFERWAETLPLQDIKDNLGGLSDDDRRAILIHAYDSGRPGSMSLTEPNGFRFATSVRGVTHLLWMSLRKKNPDMEPEALAAMLSLNDLKDAQKIVQRSSGMASADPTMTSP